MTSLALVSTCEQMRLFCLQPDLWRSTGCFQSQQLYLTSTPKLPRPVRRNLNLPQFPDHRIRMLDCTRRIRARNPHHFHPGRAAPTSIPAGASSITRHSAGANPNPSAPFKYGSGCGFPFFTSSDVTRTSGTGSPQKRSRLVASSRDPDVTTPHRPYGIDFTRSAAPGITVTPL